MSRIGFHMGVIAVVMLACGCQDSFEPESVSSYYEVQMPTDSTAPTPRINASVGIETGELTVHWSAVNGAIRYELEESSPGLGVRYHYMGTSTTYFVGRVTDGRRYTFRVRAVFVNTTSRWSDALTIP